MTLTRRIRTHQYLAPDGTPCVGTVTFTIGTAGVSDLDEPATVLSESIEVTLDVDGEISAPLICNDDMNVDPQDWAWVVDEDVRTNMGVGVGRPRYGIMVSIGDPATSDLDSTPHFPPDVAVAEPCVRVVNGESGPVVVLDAGDISWASPTPDPGSIHDVVGGRLDAAELTLAGLGTAATRNVGAADDEVVLGGDPRMDDSRTPTAHSVTHGAGMPDAVTPASIGALTAGDNLSDIPVLTVARSNLNLGWVDVRNEGVIGDGVADDTAALNAAAAFAASTGCCLFIPSGTYRITGTITFACDVMACRGATVRYEGASSAIVVGSLSTAVEDVSVEVPTLIYVNKPPLGWGAGSVGVTVSNTYASSITIRNVVNFETGLLMWADGTGCVHNNIYPMHLENNGRSIVVDATATGWVNQNTFIGGRTSHYSGEGVSVAAARHILIETTTNAINNNTFIGTSFEGNTARYLVDVDKGVNNTFINCRWEGANGVRWGAGAVSNIIWNGYGVGTLAQTNTAGSAYNRVQGPQQYEILTGGYGEVAENSGSSNYAVFTIMEAGAKTTGYTPAAGQWRAFLGANEMKFKARTDTEPRHTIGFTGIKLGPGGATAQPVTMTASATTLLITTPIKPLSTTTAGRPAANTISAGGMMYDTTLKMPIWSDGAVWRDAASNAV
jgi:hypothetical protein